ncbi:hypothetical protein N4P33_33445, partial [Streptomyces sp. 15-116A]|nr:hypothetical protein [Streptomyces sp. 15-116A]
MRDGAGCPLSFRAGAACTACAEGASPGRRPDEVVAAEDAGAGSGREGARRSAGRDAGEDGPVGEVTREDFSAA